MSDWGTTDNADWGSPSGAKGASNNDFGTDNTAFDNGGGQDGFDGPNSFNAPASLKSPDDDFAAPTNGFDDPAGEGPGGGGGCYNCGEEGHNKTDCPKPRVIKCRHCNEEGHMIRDCPTAPPKEFSGECRICNQEGHMAKDCPDKPADVCFNCKEEGHTTIECTNPRKVDRSHLEEIDADVAWEKITAAAKERDMDDVKEAVQLYVKAVPETTYVDLEEAFRIQDMGVYMIAIEKPALLPGFTNMDFQGNLEKKFSITYRFSDKPARPRERELWPSSTEENLERLKDAGEVVERGLAKCSNCSELGHISRNCPSEKVESERVVVTCYNCGEAGHRVRECPVPRVDRFACKNCGQSGHMVAECTEPRPERNADDVECRKCGTMGHFSRDCPQGGGGGSRGCFNCGQEGHSARDCTEPKKTMCRNCDQEGHTSRECPEPKNMDKVQCRNCDEWGHESRQCPKERDYSRVTCQNCGKNGHTKVRCKEPTVAPEDHPENDGGFGAGDDAAAAPMPSGGDSWETAGGNDDW